MKTLFPLAAIVLSFFTFAANTAAVAQGASKDLKNLPIGSVFPDFNEKDINGKPVSVGNYKGKIVLVDFWATWCGPCVAELPHVLKTYEKYHSKGFEIIGVSLDADESKLKSSIQAKKMDWQQYFDGGRWNNKVSKSYNVRSIPATYLIDKEGKLIARNLRGEALEQAVAAALGEK